MKYLHIWASCLFGAVSVASGVAAAPTWEKDVRPILKNRCFKCHGDDEQKADLNLQTIDAALKGGSSGEVLKKGRPNSSLLMQAIEHEEGVEKMPPKSGKMPDEEIALIRAWIIAGFPVEGGAASGGVGLAYTPVVAGNRPERPAMPSGLAFRADESRIKSMASPVVAMAASPWAPVVALGGVGCVRFLNAETRECLGVVPYPEGNPQVLRFSSDGALLLVAGGKPVQQGKVVIYDVATGKRLAEFGDETDAVFAADVSPDAKWVALGGPGKVVKVFEMDSGRLAYRIEKHTDWITSLEFSPDGKRLATADRAGGIHVWETAAGGIMMSLSEHKDCVHGVSWRPDGKVLSSGSEDGSVILWGIEDGYPLATLSGIHTPPARAGEYGKRRGGILGLAWSKNGCLVTVGRDRRVRTWSSEGKKVAESESFQELPLRAVGTTVQNQILVGDARGGLSWWEPANQVAE
jgi:hypothetical protein